MKTKCMMATLLLLVTAVAEADLTDLVDEAVLTQIAAETSGEAAKRNLDTITLQHRMRTGSQFEAATQHIVNMLESYGLDDVRILHYAADGETMFGTQKSRPVWNVRSAELWEVADAGGETKRVRRLGDWSSVPLSLAQDSLSGEATTTLVDVGAGTTAADYAGSDVRGKLVLTSSQPGEVADLAVGEYGAAGIVSYAPNQRSAWWLEDERLVRWGHLDSFPRTKTFAFMISLGEARRLQRRMADGEEIRAGSVVSNLDPRRNYLKLMPSEVLPDDFRGDIERFKIRGSSGKLNIALDRQPRFTAIPDTAPELAQGTITISPNMEYLERGYDDWKRGTWSRRPFLDISVPSTIDPTIAPAGKHMMTVFVQYVPVVPADGGWTPEKRDAFADTVLSTIEEHAPGFRDSIVDLETRTPHELENEVGLTEGNIFHGELTLDQLLFNRPLPGYAQYRGPVKRFYMCGSSTHPGGGVMGAPGYNAAREILMDLKRTAA